MRIGSGLLSVVRSMGMVGSLAELIMVSIAVVWGMSGEQVVPRIVIDRLQRYGLTSTLQSSSVFGASQHAPLLNKAERCRGSERQEMHVEIWACSEVNLMAISARGCEVFGLRR